VLPSEFYSTQLIERIMKENNWNKTGWVDVNQDPRLRRDIELEDNDELTDAEKAELALKKEQTTYQD
jgi:hypothetical protein